MTISKLTNNIQPLDEVDKINEIIDELGNIDTLPSQTGNANKFLTTDGTDASWSAVPTRNIGEIVESAIPLTDAGLHLLDGALIQGSGIYSDFVTYISGLVSTYPDLFITEANWQSAVTNYGVCGKFVYDSVNNTVRLPKITGIVEGTTDVTALGDLVQAGLPIHTHTRGTMNITGQVQGSTQQSTSTLAASGCFSQGSVSKQRAEAGNSDGYLLNFDASRNWTGSTSNPNYSNSSIQNSSTVQPQTIKVLYYIVVATTTKTEIEVDIDNVVTDLNGKLDIAGGTMTGDLSFNASNYPASTPSSNVYYTPFKFEANNVLRGLMGLEYTTNGKDELLIQYRKDINGTTKYNSLTLGFDSEGNSYTYANAHSSAINSIVTTLGISKSAIDATTKPYFKLGNGLTVCFGYQGSSSSATITFPVAYTSAKTYIALALPRSSNAYGRVDSVSSTQCTFYWNASVSFGWVIIGY